MKLNLNVNGLLKLNDRTLGPLAFLCLMLPTVFQLNYLYSPGGLNTWGITEWLISYDGGFVRRGISGQVLKSVSEFSGVSPSVLVVLFSVIAWVILTILLLKISNGKIKRYFLFSPLLLGMPIYSNFLIRKDIFQLLILTTILLVLRGKLNLFKVL